LSHPGVYEPTDTAAGIAANAWEIDCSMGADLSCPGFDDPGNRCRYDNRVTWLSGVGGVELDS